MNKFKKSIIAAGCAALLGSVALPAHAVNWLMLQGTEKQGAAPRAKVWGFLQPTYQKDYSKITGPEPTRIGPNLDSQRQFQLQRARVGVRGQAFPLDNNVNYFFLAEFGHNAITDGGLYGTKQAAKITDASVTFNHIPGMRVRTGLFKTPGPEEVFQGIFTFDYINFTDVSNQMMLERFPGGVGSGDGVAPFTPAESNGFIGFGAARDHGIQFFDSFKSNGWDHSYAVMIGNGNGLESSGIAEGEETYLYWSSEKLIQGGIGPWAHGLKFFAWSHSGQRKVDMSDDGVVNPVVYDRKRSGVGARYRAGDWRVAAEYMKGEGMIFQGPEKPNFGFGTPPPLQDLNGEADGYYVDVGYYIPGTKWELDFRYDVYNRSTTHQYLTAEFNTMTYGVQYHFNRKTKFTLNYIVRDHKATDPIGPGGLATPTTNLHNGLEGIGDRLAVQATVVF